MAKFQVVADSSRCSGCRSCQLWCSLRQEGAFVPAKALVTIRRLVGQDHEFDVSFSAECDHCGVCVKYCFYGALRRERKEQV